MGSKIRAIAAVIMMVAVAFVGASGFVSDANDADASATAAANVNVYFKGPTDTSYRAPEAVNAYDLYQAVKAASAFTATATETNSSWKQLMNPGQYQYYNPNENYGVLSSITVGNTTYDISNFTIYVYNAVSGTTNYSWNIANPALGWYHPYSDYSATYSVGSGTDTITYSMAAASIAIVYGSGAPSEDGRTPTTITQSDAYKYTFTIKSEHNLTFNPVVVKKIDNGVISTTMLTTTNIKNGMTIVGWGSNAYEALKSALGASNVVGGETYAEYIDMESYGYYQYYSWLDKVLNIVNNITF